MSIHIYNTYLNIKTVCIYKRIQTHIFLITIHLIHIILICIHIHIIQVHAYAGKDTDIVHWEQSYNCNPRESTISSVPIEQFIRQSMLLPNQPVVVLSTSYTPNWVSTSIWVIYV